MTKEEYNEKINTMNKCIEYWMKKAEKLEKENAELKEINTHTLSQLNLDNGELIIELTKAKDHIKKLLDCLQQDTNDPQTNYYVVKYMTEAEQFLSEMEK